MTEKKVPARTCVACRKEFDKKSLIRVVRTKDGGVFVDPTGKANGRGAYFCGSAECLKKLRKAKTLDRAFGVSVPEEVYTRLEEIADEKR